MPKKEPSLFRIAAVFVLIVVGIGSLKLGIPQAIAQYGINYLSDGMMDVSKQQQCASTLSISADGSGTLAGVAVMRLLNTPSLSR